MLGLNKNKLQAYILKNVEGQDRWIRHYNTPGISQIRTHFKCANLMVTQKKSLYYAPTSPSELDWCNPYLLQSDVDDDYSNDIYDHYSPDYDSNEDDYFAYDS